MSQNPKEAKLKVDEWFLYLSIAFFVGTNKKKTTLGLVRC